MASPGATLASALKLARELEAKLSGNPLSSDAAALSELLSSLAAAASAGDTKREEPAAGGEQAAPAGEELSAALATSCMVPRGKFDLVLRDGAPHTLCGTAAAQHWQLPMDDVVQLAAVPKGDSVKPMVLVVAQLRKPLATYKKDGSLKSKGSPYLVMQFPGKELQGAAVEFVAAMAAAAGAKEICTPSASVFRSMCARPNQPNCALKVGHSHRALAAPRTFASAGRLNSPLRLLLQCFRDVSDGFLYLVKGCILFVPSSGSAILALCTRWLGSVSFARSPTGRSFSMTVEVDSERTDSEKVGEAAVADASYTFNEMDVADENSVNECVGIPFSSQRSLRGVLLKGSIGPESALRACATAMSRRTSSDQAGKAQPSPLQLQHRVKAVRSTARVTTTAAAMTRQTSRTTRQLREKSGSEQNESGSGR